jgi:hypothetical protein
MGAGAGLVIGKALIPTFLITLPVSGSAIYRFLNGHFPFLNITEINLHQFEELSIRLLRIEGEFGGVFGD